jgi:outer membrane immunogenic protein
VLNLRTSYNITPSLQLYALVENATNTRTRNFGTFFDTTSINFVNFYNPKMVSVGPPTAFYGGMKWDFGAEPEGWMALARDERDEPVAATSAPRKWAGLYAGLNAGYGFGATTGVGVTPFGYADHFASFWNGNLVAEEADEAPWWSLLQAGGAAAANAGGAQVSRSGFIGGGQIGWNYQDSSNVVLGVEADFQGAAFGGRGSYVGGMTETAGFIDKEEEGELETLLLTRQGIGGGSVSAGTNWIGTARGRLGYAFADSLLVYGTGGFAYGNVHASAVHFNASSIQIAENGEGGAYANPASYGAASYSGTRTGWTAGGGFEWMFFNNWSARAEALYYNLGTVSLTSSPMATACASCVGEISGFSPGAVLWASSPVTKTQFDGVIARAGVNYHFHWGSDVFN